MKAITPKRIVGESAPILMDINHIQLIEAVIFEIEGYSIAHGSKAEAVSLNACIAGGGAHNASVFKQDLPSNLRGADYASKGKGYFSYPFISKNVDIDNAIIY